MLIVVERIEIKEFINRSETFPVIDVRSPSEFKQGHIKGAINLALFSDEERKDVGIKYKLSGRDPSVILGLEIAGPKLSTFVKTAKKISANKEILLHCWRGGMRSESMAWLFDFSSIKTSLLVKGYKNYRNYIRKSFENSTKIIVLGGKTGSGKTEILKELKRHGQQVLDLEALANHKGSAFGFIGQEEQPTNEQFENDIFDNWNRFDFSRYIWIEDESQSIGKVQIPASLFLKMREAIVFQLDKNKDLRIKRLIGEYSNCDSLHLKTAIEKISKRLGGLRTKKCFDAIEKQDYHNVADMSLEYYDKAYLFGLSQRKPEKIIQVFLENNNVKNNTSQILKHYQELLGNNN